MQASEVPQYGYEPWGLRWWCTSSFSWKSTRESSRINSAAKCQRITPDNGCQHLKNTVYLNKIAKLKKRSRWVQHELQRFRCLEVCSMRHFRISNDRFLQLRNLYSMTIVNDQLNVMILTNHPKTFRNQKSTNRRLGLLFGVSILDLAIIAFWNPTRKESIAEDWCKKKNG